LKIKYDLNDYFYNERMLKMNTGQQNNDALSKKEKAVSFLQLVASGKVREGYNRYIGSGFCHHNPYFRGDADSLMLAMEENATKNPDKIFDVKRAIEEGELVAVHSHVKQNQGDLGAAVVHIFRFEDDRIVEMWDIGQPIPGNSPNENGIF
jgi:predicted SnoaL-like aldol condensation-catalyzing enzyme